MNKSKEKQIMTSRKGILITLSVIFCSYLFLNNSMLLIDNNTVRRPSFLAHRGLAQTFDIENVKWNTNSAAIIHKPEHEFIENTIPSMEAAFNYGAEIVEIDIRVTRDKKLVVFHDFNVNFRTEKEGNVSDYTLEELQQLDVGYGYTYDNGNTYPLRTKGIGLMPSFIQVIEKFPGRKFLIHIRDNGPEIGTLLLGNLKKMSKEEVALFSIYGNDEAICIIKEHYPEMKALSLKLLKKALIQYELIGWTGYIPRSIHNLETHLPLGYAKFLWGWPEKFVNRMNKVNSRVVLIKQKGQWSGGFDSVEEIREIPENYHGYIWTNRIDRVGKGI